MCCDVFSGLCVQSDCELDNSFTALSAISVILTASVVILYNLDTKFS